MQLGNKFERKKYLMIKQLDDGLELPYQQNNKGMNSVKRSARDPLGKIIKTNDKVVKFKRIQNQKLLQIL